MALENETNNAYREFKKLFKDFENDYLFQNWRYDKKDLEEEKKDESRQYSDKKKLNEIKKIKSFLETPCKCGLSCQEQFDLSEMIDARESFNLLSWKEKGCFLLPLLNSFKLNSRKANSARSTQQRSREKYVYKINSDRKVCRNAFLFYYDISLKKLKFFQSHLNEVGLIPIQHGNFGKKPGNAYSENERNFVRLFMINFSAVHGLPDPGRDLRTGVDKLKIFLPSAMSYKHVHQVYLKSLPKKEKPVEYQSFIKTWHELTPNIQFQRPRTDLCKICEDHIKNIRMAIGRKKEDEKIKYHQQAIAHLKQAKNEREHYKKLIKKSQQTCIQLFDKTMPPSLKKRIKKKFTMHYSWDFAQQLHYPYEDQQVGPIYFKTPRKAELFGVCCEGVPFQLNYLIDEADFLNKGANTVISLLDHFFLNHSLGESKAYLTADNCVGQNKNNAVIQYLLYRTIVGLHDEINLAFMIVGHTKFGPDGYFGLIKRIYRKSKIYTYNQLTEIINKSSPNGHVICQTHRNTSGEPNYKYYRWDKWLLKYFNKLPEIKKFHHFLFNRNNPGEVIVKEELKGKEIRFNLLKNNKALKEIKSDYPITINPTGLSIERQWYLYDKIREHIPNEIDKNVTCPLPKHPKCVKK